MKGSYVTGQTTTDFPQLAGWRVLNRTASFFGALNGHAACGRGPPRGGGGLFFWFLRFPKRGGGGGERTARLYSISHFSP